MNWEAIGAIGEIVGAMAVFITLIYLAVQVRHARSEARRALSQGRGEALRDVITLQLDERVNRVMVEADRLAGSREPYPLVAALEQQGMGREEASLVFWNLIAWWNYFLHVIPRINELPEMERAQFDVPIGLYGRPGVYQLFYEIYVKRVAHPDALRYIEGVLAQNPVLKMGGNQ